MDFEFPKQHESLRSIQRVVVLRSYVGGCKKKRETPPVKRKTLRVPAVDETRRVRHGTRVLHADFGARVRRRVHLAIVLGQVPGPSAANSVDSVRRGRRTCDGRLHVGNTLAVRQPRGNRATR